MKATTSLGSIEERLRRSLDLVGIIGTEFTPSLTPVVVADDATRPGCNLHRNRSWCGIASNPNVAAGSSFTDYFLFLEDCIVDGVGVQNESLSAESIRVRLALAPPGTVPPAGVVPAPFAFFTERGGPAPAPVGRDGDAAALSASFSAVAMADASPGAFLTFSQGGLLRSSMFVPRNGWLAVEATCQGGGAADYLVNVAGRIF